MKRVSLILAALALTLTFSCKNGNKADKGDKMMNDADSTSTMSDESMSKDKMDQDKTDNITLTKVTNFKDYSNVSLKMTEPSKSEVKEGKVNFKFDVKNLKVGEQTDDAGENGLANSGKGQHIHVIVDNKPYTAHYKATFEQDIKTGEHLIVAFPARSYHMSIKNKDAVAVKKLTVGEPSESQKMTVDLSAPHLIYSRPKGTYSGKDTKKVLLDFYLLNTDLAPDGNKVKATINGQDFMIDDWAPYAMEGLPMGKNTVKLELVDENGQMIEGPFNKVERSFTLKK